MNASAILDQAQVYLHDDGTLWTRAELLGYLNHGYMRLLTETDAVRRLAAQEVPARHHWATAYPWEQQRIPGAFREWTQDAQVQSHYRVSYQWEAEQLQGAVPVASRSGCTHSWERLYLGDIETADRYAGPSGSLSTYRIVHNGRRLSPTSVGELDSYTARWDQTSGSPAWYAPAMGKQGDFEVFPQVADYTQAVQLKGMLGTVRRIGNYTVASAQSGRTLDGKALVTRGLYALGAWGKRLLTRGLLGISSTSVTTPTDTIYPTGAFGTIRRLSGDVQHIMEYMDWPGTPPVGVPRRWTGSVGSLLQDYSIHAPTLTEDRSPDLLPSQFAKYLRWYVISRALAREGEGTNTKLAAHYEQKFALGLTLLHRMALLATSARTYQNRPQEMRSGRPMRPRLPAEYPRVR